MSQQSTKFDEWTATARYFRHWLTRHGKTTTDRRDQRTFGNSVIEGEVSGLRVRLVHDRGTIVLDVSLGEQWHSGRNVLAFHDGVRAQDIEKYSQIPDGAVLELQVGQIVDAINNPRLSVFEQEIGNIALARLSTQPVSELSNAS